MNAEQIHHMEENVNAFGRQYFGKYRKGQEEHGGNMWTMGLTQVVECAEEEALDFWSYTRQIRHCIGEIQAILDTKDSTPDWERLEAIRDVLNRVKKDEKEAQCTEPYVISKTMLQDILLQAG